MREHTMWRRLSTAAMALVVLSTAMVVAPMAMDLPEAAAWDPVPNGVQPGSERIPFQVHQVSRTLETGRDGQGRPMGYCYDESYITFDTMYGKGRFNDSFDPSNENYVFHRIHTNSQGVQTAPLVYTADSNGAVFDINFPQGSSLPNPWLTFDHWGLVVYRVLWGGSQTTVGSGYLVDREEVAPAAQSYCAPSRRTPRAQGIQATMEA